MKTKLTWIPIAFFALCSCTQRDRSEVTVVEEFPKVIQLSGTPILVEENIYYYFYAVDSLLLGATRESSRGLVFAYNGINLDSLGVIVRRGRGPSEFLWFESCPEYLKEPDGIKIIGYDQSLSKYVKINLTRSIESGKTCIEYERTMPDNIYAVTPVSDSIVLATTGDEIYNPNNEEPEYSIGQVLYNIYTDKFENIDIVKTPENDKYANRYQYGYRRLLSDPYKMLVFYAHLNRFKIFDINDRSEVHLSVYGGPVSPSGLSENWEENITYYNSFTSGQQYIYGVYMQQTWEEIASNTQKAVEIHVFKYDGSPVASLQVNENIRFVCVDEERKIMYGTTMIYDTYKYDISDVF